MKKKQMLTLEKLKIDCTKTISEIINFIKNNIEETNSKGAIISASGGIDSTVLLFLTIKALGNEKIIALMIPERDITNPNDIADVKEISEKLGVTCDIIEITPHIHLFHDRTHIFEKLDRVSKGNIKARLRMMIAYAYANHFKKLVLGSTNKTEWLTGYFTKYGDGAIDLMPLADLYKTQIRQLARNLKVPLKIIKKRPSAGLWPQQYDEEELGIQYEKLDLILYGYELGMKDQEIARELDIELTLVRSILDRVNKTEHKRKTPKILKLNSNNR